MKPNPPFPHGPADMPGFSPSIHHDTAPDRALEELRVSYARPELDRSDLIERSADLGGPLNRDATLPGRPPAPDQR